MLRLSFLSKIELDENLKLHVYTSSKLEIESLFEQGLLSLYTLEKATKNLNILFESVQ